MADSSQLPVISELADPARKRQARSPLWNGALAGVFMTGPSISEI